MLSITKKAFKQGFFMTTFVKKRPLLQKGFQNLLKSYIFMVKIGILFKVPREFFITTGPCQPTYLQSRPRRTDSPAFKGREIMHKINYSTKILTAAVLCSLLNATPVWAASKTTTSTVEQSNTSDTPYSKITVVGTGWVYGIHSTDDDLTVYVTGDNVLAITANNTAGTADAEGVSSENRPNSTYVKGTLSGDVKATGGIVDNSAISGVSTAIAKTYASAYGVYSDTDNFGSEVYCEKIGNLTVTAKGGTSIGGTATSNSYAYAYTEARASAAGLCNVVQTKDIGNLTITATGGTATAGNATCTDDNGSAVVYADAGASAQGIAAFSDETKTYGNVQGMTITATGGTATAGKLTGGAADANNAGANASASAYGLYVLANTVTVEDLSDVEVSATGGNATVQQSGASAKGGAYAYGIFGIDQTSQVTINVTGNVKIKSSATPGTETDSTGATSPAKFGAYSLYADQGAIINVGVDTSEGYPNANNKTVQLEGDISAQNQGTNNVILSGSNSSLQGNILSGDTSTNNITFTNGATWHPVFDNRYGSFIEDGDYTTYSPSYTVNSISTTANLTLSDKATIDLTWDNATRDPATTARTMTLSSLSGADGVLVVNTNLAQSVADQFIITNNSATSLGIDVNYDPALTASGLDNNSDISGNAKVLTISSGTTPTVTGVSDSYNTYDYTPTITNNGDGTYSVTKLTITNKTPVEPTNPTNPTEPTNPTDNPTTPTKTTITSPSSPMREARHQRMAMHNMWVNGELNNMEKRMGDLRAAEPAEAGIWARYEYNKLEKGSNANLKYNYFQLGYDKDFKGDTGSFYRGVAFSYGKGDGSYEVGTGDLKEGAMTLYQTWVGKSGNYYDIVAKAGKLLNDYNAVNTANPYTSDYHSWAYSVGGEVGKRFKKNNGFFVEPQFEFTLGRINGADYTTSTGMNVNVDAQNSAVARIGVAVGKEIKNIGSYYAKASYFHDFGGGLNLTASDSTTNPFSYGEDSAKNWCIFTLGGAVKAGKNCNVFGELSKYTGELSNNIQVNVGARWSF